jgi:hypothetical protein
VAGNNYCSHVVILSISYLERPLLLQLETLSSHLPGAFLSLESDMFFTAMLVATNTRNAQMLDCQDFHITIGLPHLLPEKLFLPPQCYGPEI